ncbi:MAG: hypothetical protein COA93_10350 [Alphaproteobacteria bacterium]|nr:MAG: hypothetical protein COA93_10350 [Alphaproteobacteria bacterium]
MNKDIDRALAHYSKINFQNDLKNLDLKNLEKDVYGRISQNRYDRNDRKNIIERWFGIPASLGGSIMASTLIVGVFFGAQLQTEPAISEYDEFGFEVFSVKNSKLPSSLLVSEL